MRGLVMAAALGFVIGGCGKDEHEKHGAHGGSGGTHVPESYAEAVKECEELSAKIDSLIASGKLADVHKAAQGIKEIAEALPSIAGKELSQEAQKEVAENAPALAALFTEIDEAADAGMKADTIKVHGKMKELIAALRAHAK